MLLLVELMIIEPEVAYRNTAGGITVYVALGISEKRE